MQREGYYMDLPAVYGGRGGRVKAGNTFPFTLLGLSGTGRGRARHPATSGSPRAPGIPPLAAPIRLTAVGDRLHWRKEG
jgi:hypothetical protein